jgi:hypothetical protein
MSIGIGFDDDYSTALAEYKSRNGMSVKEMYGALNNHDRLVECLKKEREKYDVLIKRINDACWKIACIKTHYRKLASGPYSTEDRLEFEYRAKGLEEAMDILRRSMEVE